MVAAEGGVDGQAGVAEAVNFGDDIAHNVGRREEEKRRVKINSPIWASPWRR